MYVIAEADSLPSTQHEYIQSVFLGDQRKFRNLRRYFYDSRGFLKVFKDNPSIKNLSVNSSLDKNTQKQLISAFNRFLFLQQHHKLDSHEYNILQNAIRDLVDANDTADFSLFKKGVEVILKPNVDIKQERNFDPLEKILKEIKLAKESKLLTPQEVLAKYQKVWDNIVKSVHPLLILKAHVNELKTPEARQLLAVVAELSATGLPRFIIEDYVFACFLALDSPNPEAQVHLNNLLNLYLERIKLEGIKDPLDYALFRESADQPMPLFAKIAGTNERGFLTENDPNDPDHCKELMKMLKQMAPEFRKDMEQIEGLLEDIINKIYSGSNDAALQALKVKLATNFDSLLFHIFHGELNRKFPSGVHFDLEKLKERCCFILKIEETLGNGIKAGRVISKRNGNSNIGRKSLFSDLLPTDVVKAILKTLKDIANNNGGKFELSECGNFFDIWIKLKGEVVVVRINIKGGKINTFYPK